MAYKGRQVSLLVKAAELAKLGYTIGLAKGKALAKLYESSVVNPFTSTQLTSNEGDWDGLSIVLDGIVCVDFDVLDMDLGWYYLPPTWKERSPRGYHLFYRLDDPLPNDAVRVNSPYTAKIKWRRDVDLLVRNEAVNNKKATKYGGGVNVGSPFYGHALIAPSDGYKRIWPDNIPARDKLVMAPDWLKEALSKP